MTKESSSKKLETCLNIDSKTLMNESTNEIDTRTRKHIAYAKGDIISVKDTTIARHNLIETNCT